MTKTERRVAAGMANMFYRSPPEGSLSTFRLQELTRARVRLLSSILQLPESLTNGRESRAALPLLRPIIGRLPVVNDDDSTGHFTLRMAVSTDARCWESWVQSEVQLFAARLKLMDIDELTSLLIDCRGHEGALRMLPDDKPLVFLLATRFAAHDQRETFPVPFQLVPSLVSSRTVALHGGIAQVPCTYLADVLISSFAERLREGRSVCRRAYSQGTLPFSLSVPCACLPACLYGCLSGHCHAALLVGPCSYV